MQQIYVHGLGQTAESWNKVDLGTGFDGNRTYLNLADLIHGKDAAYENLYSAFSDVCDAKEDMLRLCGLSLGGVLALNYAIDHPEKTEALVLVAPQYKMPKKLLRFQNAVFRLMPNRMFQEMGFKKAGFLKLCSTMMELDFSDSVKKIACPSLVICGGKDTANKKAAVELAGLLTHCELQIFDGVGHEVNIEAPEKLGKAIRGFYLSISNLAIIEGGN